MTMAEFEHGIFLLLLLVGVLNAKPPRPALMTLVILIGFLLAFLPPARQVPIPWELVLGLAVPVLLWQNGRRLVHARWRQRGAEIVLWAAAALAFGATVWVGSDLAWTGSVLFGLLAASMLWRAVEPEDRASHIGQLGPLTLVFLLAEVAPAVETPTRYLGGMFSGAAIGIAIAFLAGRAAVRLRTNRTPWIALGQVYLSYGLAAFIDASAIVAALFSVLIFTEIALREALWPNGEVRPAPLNTTSGFLVVLALLLLLGWQAHQPLTPILLLEVAIGLVVGWAVWWLGRRLQLGWFRDAPWQIAARIGLLLFAAVLVWPRPPLLQASLLAIAIGLAALISVLSVTVLAPLMQLQAPVEPDSS